MVEVSNNKYSNFASESSDPSADYCGSYSVFVMIFVIEYIYIVRILHSHDPSWSDIVTVNINPSMEFTSAQEYYNRKLLIFNGK